jgi:hypothetical protein
LAFAVAGLFTHPKIVILSEAQSKELALRFSSETFNPSARTSYPATSPQKIFK